ncbi:MAG: hypothetical protein KDB80_15305 [Planctomycetes bacterium]|nr:hypothetical protein [Planctomycetota bacterium]
MTRTHTLFDGLRRQARLGITIEASSWCLLAFTTFVFVSYGVDRWLRLETPVRALILIAAVASIGVTIVRRWLQPMSVELTDDELALAVERQDPGLRQALISAVQFQRGISSRESKGESAELMTRVVDDVDARLRELPFHRAIDRWRTGRFTALAAACFAVCAAWFAWSADARLWAARNVLLSSEPWPRATRLEFADVDAGRPLRVAERDDLTIRVVANGVIPDEVFLDCEFADGTTSRRETEQIGARTFTVTLDSLLEDARIRAFGGDGESDVLEIRLVPRPRFEGLAIEIEHPEYLGGSRHPVDELASDVDVPDGSTVHVRARSDKPLASASLVFGDDRRIEARIDSDRHGMTAQFVPDASGTLRVDGLDDDRLGPDRAPQVFLRLVEDRAPSVEFRVVGVGSLITAVAMIPGNLTIQDDHGLRSVSAWFQVTDATPIVSGEAAVEVPFESAPVAGLERFVAGPPSFETDTLFDLTSLTPAADPIPENQRVKPGTLLALRFGSTDAFRPTAHESFSETMHFRVVTREKLLEELKRRQAEQRRELEAVLEREQSLRDGLAEILSPSGDDPRTAQARANILALSRRQQVLGRRVDGIGDRYEKILLELLNNRLFEEPVTRAKRAKIVTPLRTLAAQDFPATSVAAATFGESGTDAARTAAVQGCDRIIAAIRRVLAEMEHTEDIAAVLEALRVVIRTEQDARELVERSRDAGIDDLFDEPPKDGPR